MKQIRKQKWIFMVITLMMCIAVSGTKGSQKVSAATSGDFEYEEKADGTVEITHYNGHDSDVTIPEVIEEKSVTSIGNNAFASCDYLTSITLPSSLTSIGDEAFANCENLTNVTLPSNVVQGLGKDVFVGCDNLIFYDVKKNSDFEKYAIQYGCNIVYAKGTTLTVKSDKCKVKVTSVKPDNLTVEYKGTTDKKGKRITVPSQVKINNMTYQVTKIADGAFSGNKKIEFVEIYANITAIGKNAFKNCKKLGSVVCHSTDLNKIGDNAFRGDGNLGYIGLWSTTKLTKKSIGKNALKGTSNYLQIEVLPNKASTYKNYFKGKGNNAVRVTGPTN